MYFVLKLRSIAGYGNLYNIKKDASKEASAKKLGLSNVYWTAFRTAIANKRNAVESITIAKASKTLMIFFKMEGWKMKNSNLTAQGEHKPEVGNSGFFCVRIAPERCRLKFVLRNNLR